MVDLLAAAVLASAVAAAPVDPQVAHGARIAQRCAACHAVAREDQSHNSGAPPFRDLARRSNSAGLAFALQRIAKQGHFEMRPTRLSEADSQDLAAYIATLDSAR